MAKEKRYFWLKLNDDFFNKKEIKKLRKIAGGDTYTIIFLKLQLLSLKTDCKLYFDNVEDNFHEELALEIDEDSDNVKIVLMFLEKNNLIEYCEENTVINVLSAKDSVGSESSVAGRVRASRERKKALLGNTTETICYTEKRREEKEIDIDKEIDREIDIEKQQTHQSIQEYVSLVSEATGTNLYQVQQVINLALLRNYDINMLMLKIKESDFLLGLLDSKPTIRNFTQKSMIDKILADFYRNNVKKEKKTEMSVIDRMLMEEEAKLG